MRALITRRTRPAPALVLSAEVLRGIRSFFREKRNLKKLFTRPVHPHGPKFFISIGQVLHLPAGTQRAVTRGAPKTLSVNACRRCQLSQRAILWQGGQAQPSQLNALHPLTYRQRTLRLCQGLPLSGEVAAPSGAAGEGRRSLKKLRNTHNFYRKIMCNSTIKSLLIFCVIFCKMTVERALYDSSDKTL